MISCGAVKHEVAAENEREKEKKKLGRRTALEPTIRRTTLRLVPPSLTATDGKLLLHIQSKQSAGARNHNGMEELIDVGDIAVGLRKSDIRDTHLLNIWQVVPGAADMWAVTEANSSPKLSPTPEAETSVKSSPLYTCAPFPLFTYPPAYTKSQETYWLQPMAERPLARRNWSLVTPRASLLLSEVRL